MFLDPVRTIRKYHGKQLIDLPRG